MFFAGPGKNRWFVFKDPKPLDGFQGRVLKADLMVGLHCAQISSD